MRPSPLVLMIAPLLLLVIPNTDFSQPLVPVMREEHALATTDGAWAELVSIIGTPPNARAFDSAIYDSVSRRMVMFGGWDGSYYDDAWTLSLAGTQTWTGLTPSGTPPIGRSGQGGIYDPVRDRMLVFGGY